MTQGREAATSQIVIHQYDNRSDNLMNDKRFDTCSLHLAHNAYFS